jgi:hypothetical protein
LIVSNHAKSIASPRAGARRVWKGERILPLHRRGGRVRQGTTASRHVYGVLRAWLNASDRKFDGRPQDRLAAESSTCGRKMDWRRTAVGSPIAARS